MFQIDTATAVAVEPAAGPPGAPGWATDGNPLTNTPATIISADWFNAVQGELLSILAAAGIAPTKGVQNQVLQALDLLIEAKTGNYSVDTGAANAYVIALSPPIAAYTENFSFNFRAIHANNGACQINFGPGFVALDRDDGSAMQQGDILANSIISGIYDVALNQARVTGIVPSQLGALAKLNVGLGLKPDGAGGLMLATTADGSLRLTANGLQANEPITHIAVAQNITAASHFGNFVNASDDGVIFTLADCAGLWNGFCFLADAQGGPIVLQPNAANTITAGGVTGADGASFTIGTGGVAVVSCDDTGNWTLPILLGTAARANASSNTGVVMAASGAFTPGHIIVAGDALGTGVDGGIAGAAAAPTYINTNQAAIGPGRYLVDTSAGPLSITLTTTFQPGQSVELIDAEGSFAANNMTVNLNGQTITPPFSTAAQAGPIVFNCSGTSTILWWTGSTFRVI